jgi:acyl-CoA thioester hydrolase
VHSVSTRWSDLDAYGHVNNVRFYDYVAEARIHMTTDADTSATRMSAAAEADHLWLIARQDMEYLRQMRYRPEPYEVWTSVARIGRTSVTLVAEIRDPVSDAPCARAHTVLVCAGDDGRPVRLPSSLRDGLGRYRL